MSTNKQFDKIAISKDPIARRPIGVSGIHEYTITQDAASVAANTVGAESFTLTGVKAGDHVIGIVPPTIPANLCVGQPYVTADDTVIVPLSNTTAGAIDPASGDWVFLVMATDDF